MSDYTLGLDLGPNSIGWALVETRFNENGEPTEYLGFKDCTEAAHPPMGVRIFEEGIPNLGTGKEKPRAQERRLARSARRVHARRTARKLRLRRILQAHGFLPEDPAELQKLLDLANPYALRAKGLDEELEPHELGRALYHLVQRRGFKSNRKSTNDSKDKKPSETLAAISSLEDEIADSGVRSLGEYLYKVSQEESDALSSGEIRLRDRRTSRGMIQEEVRLLCDRQLEFHPGLGDIRRQLEHAIFFQHSYLVDDKRRRNAPSRANLHRSPQLARCVLEPSEPRCSKSSWQFQEFRILKETHNLRVIGANGKQAPLSEHNRQIALEILRSRKTVKFDSLRKELKLHEYDRFNLEAGGRKALDGNAIDALLASALGKKNWSQKSDEDQHALRQALDLEEDPDEFDRIFVAAGCDEKGLAKLKKYNPSDAYGSYSIKTLERLIPLMADGARSEHDAVAEAYPEKVQIAQLTKLPALVQKELLPRGFKNLSNPVVTRALTEIRKVVNAIVRVHGLPRQIVVEMARQMKQGKKARDKVSKQNRDRQDARRAARDRVAELGGNPESRSDVLRVLLWEEQGHLCAYSGRPISQAHLFNASTELDHILPRWRSADDSQMNKVLVFAAQNQEKGDKTPAEWLGSESEKFHELVERARGRCQSGAMPWAKLKRLQAETVDADGFTSRQLNDTSYIARLTVSFLELLYPAELRSGEKSVRTTRGGLTAELRRAWGLNAVYHPFQRKDGTPCVTNHGEIKVRSDHRHHAVDALVVALSSRASLKRHQDTMRRRTSDQASDNGRGYPLPWETIRDDAEAACAQIYVSHRVQTALRGAHHEETFYGATKDWSGLPQQGVFVRSVALADMNKSKHLEAVRDHRTRAHLKNVLLQRGWDGKSSSLPKDWAKDPVLSENGRQHIRRVRSLSRFKSRVHLRHRVAKSGNNARLEFYRSEQGGPLRLNVLSTRDALMRKQRTLRGEPEVLQGSESASGEELVETLGRKESVLARHPHSGDDVLLVVQMLTVSLGRPKATFRDARDSRPATEGNKDAIYETGSSTKFREAQFRKVVLDPLGRIVFEGNILS